MSARTVARPRRDGDVREVLFGAAFALVCLAIASVAIEALRRWWGRTASAVVRDLHHSAAHAVLSVSIAGIVLLLVGVGLVVLLAPPARRRRTTAPGDDEVSDATTVASAFEHPVTLATSLGADQAVEGYPTASWPDAAATTATSRATVGTLTTPRAAVVVDPAHLTSVEDLCDYFADVCGSAVDSLEIACALEWEGINDAAVQRGFHLPDVFSLSEEMYLRTSRRPGEPPPETDPFSTTSWRRPALHGLLYGLPAVVYPAASGLLVGPNALAMLVVALLVAWTLSQTVALLGYRRLTPSDLVPARQALRVGLVAGLGIAIVVLLVAESALHASTTVFWFSAGQATYMLGSSTLFVLGKERLVLVSLAPSLAGSILYLAAGRPESLEHFVWFALALSPLLVVAFGLVCTRTPRSGRRRGLAVDELRAVLPAAAFGFCAAGLLAFPAAAGLHGDGGVNPGVLLATLPISLSMGGAEWCLLWYRRRTRGMLRRTSDRDAFAHRARVALALATLQYAALAAALVVIAVLIAGAVGLLHPQAGDVSQVVAYLLLGVAMFLSLSLQALGLRAVTLAAAAAALTFEIVFREHGVPVQLVACGGLVLVVGAYALIELGAATRHSS